MSDNEKSRILIVDDEPGLREMLMDALGGGSLNVAVAASGREAIDLAAHQRPDLLITDLCLGDCTGLDVIDSMRALSPDMPAILITGQASPAALTDASHRRPIEMFHKPLDLPRLREAIQSELRRKAESDRTLRRMRRLRRLAHRINRERKQAQAKLDSACSQLTGTQKSLSNQLALAKGAMSYQHDLITARSDDEVFKSLFGLFVRHSGPVFGLAMVCDASADLQLVGRFGVPGPDNQSFCLALAKPVLDAALANPRPSLMDAGDNSDKFDPAVRKYLPGVSILSMPLVPSDGQMIGLVLLYRKGEQPFHDSDLALAEMIAKGTALAVQRNE